VKLLGESIRGKGRSEGIYDEEQFSYATTIKGYWKRPAKSPSPRRQSVISNAANI
jgi:hypothetical protein